MNLLGEFYSNRILRGSLWCKGRLYHILVQGSLWCKGRLNELFAGEVEFSLLQGIVRKFVKNYKYKEELLKYKHKCSIIENNLCKQIVFSPKFDLNIVK